MEILKEIYNQIVEGDLPNVQSSIEVALNSGASAESILQRALIPAMGQVGTLFEEGEYYVPEMLVSARSMQAGLSILKPHLQNNNVKSAGKVVIGTVKGDLHDIGKNLVSMMLEGAGYEIIDLGVDVSAEQFVEATKQYQPDILAMSALLTTTMTAMQTTIAALHAAGVRDKVKVIVGGAPVTETYARQIEADGFSPDASRAVTLAQSL
jgi:5-methyltetrahydrofolate--homocysteine methyltransferase